MASAWDQLEQQRRDRQRLKRAQLAEAVGESLSKKQARLAQPGRTAATHGTGAVKPDRNRRVSRRRQPGSSNLLSGHPAVTSAFAA